MNNFSFSQTEPISSLPRDYASLVKRVKEKKEPVIFLKRNRPVVALIEWEMLEALMALKSKLNEAEALEKIALSEKEYRAGKAYTTPRIFGRIGVKFPNQLRTKPRKEKKSFAKMSFNQYF